MSDYDVDVDACRGRQQRLIDVMHSKELDLAIVTQKAMVEWLTGPCFAWQFEPAAALSSDGHATLVCPGKFSDTAAADEFVPYEAQWYSTLRNDQRAASSRVLLDLLRGRMMPRRVGVEFSSCGPYLSQLLDAELVDVEPELYELRRRKDPDELSRIRKAILGTERMYERAREIIEPGINELEVFNQLQGAAVEEFGERLTATGNDYQCGSRGGPPRDRLARDGELYILDLGPAFRGYFADNCRTIAVSGKPTDLQYEAWQHVTRVFRHVEQVVRPGKNAQELFREAQAILDEASVGIFDHHLGHGIGLYPHEAPHLNPHWNDNFDEHDVFTVEPGLYAPELNAGIRLENNYIVTTEGVELLTGFSLDL